MGNTRQRREAGSHGHRSLAWPLLLCYLGLVVYASLFPFEGWRDQGLPPWAFVSAPWPRYWSRFDIAANLLGYLPLGALVTLAWARSGWPRLAPWLGVLLPAAVSLALETLQGYLPQRVPSQADALLNTAGAALGAAVAWLALQWRWLHGWSSFRQDWLRPGAQAAWVLLLLWPFAVLYPSVVPFGTGQVWPRLEGQLRAALQGTPWQAWLPPGPPPAAPGPLTEAWLVALSLLVPVLLGYASVRRWGQRVVFVGLLGSAALGCGALAAALSFGPANGWAWLTPPVQLGLVVAAALSVLALPLGARGAALLAVAIGALTLGQLNRVPDPAYLHEWVQNWEQGRFSRFHGVLQWLGWLWPWLAVAVAARLALQRTDGPAYNGAP